MSNRKSIFKLLENKEIITLSSEYNTIYRLCNNYNVLEDGFEDYTLYQAIDEFVIWDWKYSKRSLSLNDLLEKLDISNNDLKVHNYPLESVLTYYELIYNLAFEVKKYVNSKGGIINYDVFNKIINNIKGLLEDLNYRIVRKSNNRYEIIENDAITTAVAEKYVNISDDVIEYRRYNLKGDIKSKKEILKVLADKIEPLRKRFRGTTYESLMEDVQFILNNYNIRHNNLEGSKKKEFIVNMKRDELEQWYDRCYEMILGILLLNEYLDYNKELNKYKQ